MLGGLRRDPFGKELPDAQRTRVSASMLRGIPLLRKGVFYGASALGESESITTDTETVLDLVSSVYDAWEDETGGSNAEDRMVDLTNNRIHLRLQGFWLVIGYIPWDDPIGSPDEVRQLRVWKNSLSVINGGRDQTWKGVGDAGLSRPTNRVVTMDYFDRDDYVDLRAFHTRGSALFTTGDQGDTPYLAVRWMCG